MHMRRATVLAGFFAVIVGGVFYAFKHQVANRAPDVVFKTITGEQVALRELRGHPVLVTFWASDCRSCIEEMPQFAEIYRQYSERGLKMIGVAMSYELPSRVLAIVSAHALPYSVALDMQGKHAQAFAGVKLVPNSFLIAPDGEISMHRLGLLDMQDLKARIEQMLRKV